MGLESRKFHFTLIALVISISSLLAVDLIHSAFAQDEGATFTGQIKLSPSQGPPGTTFGVYGTGFSVGSSAFVKTPWAYGTEAEIEDHEFSTIATVSSGAQPGTYTITASTVNGEASATFTVIGKKIPPPTPSTSTARGTGTQNPPPPPPPPQPPGKTALGTGNTPTSGAVSGNPTNPPPPPPQPPTPPTSPFPNGKRPFDKPQNSGATFSVVKLVVGGSADPRDFHFQVTLTGPQGSADYQFRPATADLVNRWASSEFNLDLPQGNTLSEGNYQITETNPGDYTPTYSKGCSGSYGNIGHLYTCSVTNTKKVIPNTTTNVVRGGPLPPQPGISKTTGKLTLPTVSNTGKLTLSTTPGKTTGKLTLPTVSNTGKLTLSTTPGKTTGKLTLPTVHSCPTGSIAVNGNCVSKGKIVGILQ